MNAELRRLRIQQLDQTLQKFRVAQSSTPPRAGWIKQLRQALRMSSAQLAKRLEVSQSAVSQMESSEVEGAITLNSLRKAADGLNCELVYALVPREPLEQTLTRRIREIARERIRRVAHTMALEDQAVTGEHITSQIDELTRKLLDQPPRNLWE